MDVTTAAELMKSAQTEFFKSPIILIVTNDLISYVEINETITCIDKKFLIDLPVLDIIPNERERDKFSKRAFLTPFSSFYIENVTLKLMADCYSQCSLMCLKINSVESEFDRLVLYIKPLNSLQLDFEAEFFKENRRALFLELIHGTIISNLSHEVRTPINSIMGFSQLLQRDLNLTMDQLEKVKIIRRNSELIMEILEIFIALFRLDSDQYSLPYTPVDIELTSMDLVNYLKTKLENYDIHFKYSIAVENSVKAFINRDFYYKLYINLLNYILKSCKKGCISFTVQSRNEGEKVNIYTVIEDSSDIDTKKILDSIFLGFEIDNVEFEAQESIIDLISATYMIKFLGGSFCVARHNNNGNKYEISFQFDRQLEGKVKTSSLVKRFKTSETIAKKPVALIADDNEDIRKYLAELMTISGCDVLIAKDGKIAVELYSSYYPTLVIMDIRMPIKNGYQAIQEIKNIQGTRELCIVAVSGYTSKTEQESIYAAGADFYMSKPISENLLFENISTKLNWELEDIDEKEIEESIDLDIMSNTTAASLTDTNIDQQLKQLKSAAINAQFDKLMTYIEGLKQIEPALYIQLKTLAKDYQYAKILSIIKDYEGSVSKGD